MVAVITEEYIGSGEPTPLISHQPSIFPAGTTARGRVTIISSGGEAVAVSPEELGREEAIEILEAGKGIQVGRLTFRPEPKEVVEPTRLAVTRYEPTGKIEGESVSKYQARLMREEIAFEKEQPYKQIGPVRTLREYGTIEGPEIEGYEEYKVKPKKIRPYVSRAKGFISKTFFPDVREVAEAERLGIAVEPKQKFRAEVQKGIGYYIAGKPIGFVSGLLVSTLVPKAIQAGKLFKVATYGAVGVGIVKGIKEKEYGMIIGGGLGVMRGYLKGYKFGETKLKPYLQTRFKPIKIKGVAETIAKPLPEGADKFIATTRARYEARIGKKVYAGEARAVTGIGPSPSTPVKVTGVKYYVYQGRGYSRIAKWNVKKIKSFAKTTGLSITEIKARVKTGELSSKQFIKYTKPVLSKHAGRVQARRDEYFGVSVSKTPTGLRAGVEYGRKYMEIGKAKFYKSVGREYRPRLKGPSTKLKLIQKVTVEPSKLPTGYVGPRPYQIQRLQPPQIQQVVSRGITKVITKSIRVEYMKDISRGFKPSRRLLPVVTPTKVRVVTTQAMVTKQKLRRIAPARQALVVISKQRKLFAPAVTQIMQPQVIQRQKIIPIQAQAIIPVEVLKQKLVLIRPTMPISPVTQPPITPYVPATPFIPFPILPLGFRSGRKRRIPVVARYGYTPSYRALVFKICGKKAKPAFKGRFTGFQLRPIVRGKKLITLTKRKKK